jgi:hypothetical protein
VFEITAATTTTTTAAAVETFATEFSAEVAINIRLFSFWALLSLKKKTLCRQRLNHKKL